MFVLSLVGTMIVFDVINPPEVSMPNVVGLSQDEAKQEIEDAKLKFEVDKEEYNKDVPEGYVISQDPSYVENYNKVKQGSTVKVVISKGQEKTTVPKVVGMEKEEAIKALEDANLKAEVVEETSKKVEEGYVISQETDANTDAYAGDTVKIHVSIGTGIKQVTMISVIGQTEATAKKTLEDLGLKVNISYEENTSKENGVVLKQSLDSGKEVDEGTSVTITVNKVAENKTANISIDVKSITGGYKEETTNTNNTATETTSTAKTVNITIKSGGTTLWSDSGVDKNTTKSASITGKGSMDLTVTLTDSNGGNWTRQLSINLNNETSKTVK